jgi:hypothetical protein
MDSVFALGAKGFLKCVYYIVMVHNYLIEPHAIG